MEGKSIRQPWYVLRVQTRFEKVVSNHLKNKGYEEYLPTYRSRRPWSDRIKEVDCPLFPGYIFCRFDFQNRLPLLLIPKVLSVVTFGGSPMPASEQEIAAIQNVAASGLPYGPWPFVSAGDTARIERGPLRGLEGLVVDVRGNYRLVISVGILQRAVSVEIDESCIAPVLHAQDRVRCRERSSFREPVLQAALPSATQ